MLMPYERPGTPLMRRYVGASCDGVELQRRIDDAGHLRRELLELPEVRGRERRRAARRERLENRPAERRAFLRIGARSQLVDEHERIARREAENLARGS